MIKLKIKPKNEEGTNFLYKFLATSFLAYMNRYASSKCPKTINAIKSTIQKFEEKLKNELREPFFANFLSLTDRRLLKKKHYMYGAYLAAISSFPILGKACKDSSILNSMFAKTSAITSIKVLDNINDRLHDEPQAVKSLNKHLESFISNEFQFNNPKGSIEKFENSCFMMARWAYELVQEGLNTNSPTLQMYKEDFERYINGQIRSMDQKKTEGETELSIDKYLRQVNEKGVGRIWLDVDFCFLEKDLITLSNSELEAIENVRIAADYFFKGCNIYDDIADLNEDILLGILNSVAFLALDRGYISKRDLEKPNKLIVRLKSNIVLREAVKLGDLIFLKGIEHLFKAKELAELIDIDALIFGVRVLRAFSMRKWFIKEKDIESLKS
ncbi:MAG: hypothetical protein QXG01_04385, partial [Candidatus Bathyarchaeia archaeon]